MDIISGYQDPENPSSLEISSHFEDYNCLFPICDETQKPFDFATKRFWNVHKHMMACLFDPSLERAGGHINRTMPDVDLVK